MTRIEYLELQEKMWEVLEDKLPQQNSSIDIENGVLGEYLSQMFIEALSGINESSVDLIFPEEDDK